MSLGNFRDAQVEKSSRVTLRDMLVPLFRRRRLFVLTFFGLLLGTICMTWYLSTLYEASIEVLVDRERQDPMVTTQQTNQSAQLPLPVTEEEINSEIELLQSADLLEKVVLANHLQEKEKDSITAWLFPQKDEAAYVSKAVERLAKALKVEPVVKANVFKVSYKSTDPRLCYGVMNSLANGYLEKHINVYRPKGSYNFFAKEAEEYRKALAESETRLASFGPEQKVAAPDQVRTFMAQTVAMSVGTLQQAKEAIAADEKRIKEDETQISATPARSPTLQVSNVADVLLQQLKTDLLTAQLKRTQLALKYGPHYPLVQEADQEIAETEAAIADAGKMRNVNETTDRDPTFELLREDIAKTRSDLASETATAAAADQGVQSMQLRMVDLDQKALKQADLLREVKVNESNYLLYLDKREQERTSDALDERRIANVAIAVPPEIPSLPAYKPLLVFLIGLLLSVCLSLTVGFVAEYLDPSIRTPAEVFELLNVPYVASVPNQAA
jgi:uncharacterized protein involved in exopolysaccharide biosynthesis